MDKARRDGATRVLGWTAAFMASAFAGLTGCAHGATESTEAQQTLAQASGAPNEPLPLGPCAGLGGAAGTGVVGVKAPGAMSMPPTLAGSAISADQVPPPISGGTLLLTHDGMSLVAADPDRDQLYVVDVASSALRATIALTKGDEPGRLVQDAAGHVHVALRGGGAVATVDVVSGKLLARTAVCDLPRGIAYDAASDALHVACSEGHLVTLGAATLKQTRALMVERDLRDVVVTSNGLLLTKFRSAELLRMDKTGKMLARTQPATFTLTGPGDAPCAGPSMAPSFAPTTAWRTLAMPSGEILMAHQRGQVNEVQTTSGGYSGGGCDTGIVSSVLSIMNERGEGAVYPSLFSMVLPVDAAVSATGAMLAVAAPGNYGAGGSQVAIMSTQTLRAMAVEPADLPVPAESCMLADFGIDPGDQVIAVTFVSETVVAVQTREAAALKIYTADSQASSGVNWQETASIKLSDQSRADTGHTMFHARQGAGVACASCHAEAGDDAHVWTFANIGPRRTQHLRGGILGTEPFHWNGDMTNFDMLMKEVFVGRMLGFDPASDQRSALMHWIDRQPALHATVSDQSAATRGQALFASAEVGCASCHSGALMTNNKTVNVGTGANLQVPSLHGVSFRAPFLHNGCAPTLRDRFGACGGGDSHGHTSGLNQGQLNDLIAYLETL